MKWKLHADGFWIRAFGCFLRVMNRSKRPAPFSVRQAGEMRLGKWGIRFEKGTQ